LGRISHDLRVVVVAEQACHEDMRVVLDSKKHILLRLHAISFVDRHETSAAGVGVPNLQSRQGLQIADDLGEMGW
jgi:hypothetical protein